MITPYSGASRYMEHQEKQETRITSCIGKADVK